MPLYETGQCEVIFKRFNTDYASTIKEDQIEDEKSIICPSSLSLARKVDFNWLLLGRR